MRFLCKDCIYYVIDGSKAYCENEKWKNIKKSISMTYSPFLYDCIEFSSREKEINAILKRNR